MWQAETGIVSFPGGGVTRTGLGVDGIVSALAFEPISKVCIYMYVCTYVCVRVFMYVCMYVCMFVCIYTECTVCMYCMYAHTVCMHCIYIQDYVYT